jgi:DNA-directed RNA polymerase specialized sigma24 family protein
MVSEDIADSVVSKVDLEALLLGLTDSERIVLILRYIYDYRAWKIPEKTGTSQAYAASMLHRTPARLRRNLGEYG